MPATITGASVRPLDGDRFEELYAEYWPLVFAVCRARLGCHEQAEEAAQEVFVRKWRARHTYDPARASFRTWVSRNAEHLCIDYYRRKAARPDPGALSEEMATPHPSGGQAGPSPEKAALEQGLGQLSFRQRQLVLMHEVEGYTWEEVAVITGLTVAQARNEVAKGLDWLRSFLLEQGIYADV